MADDDYNFKYIGKINPVSIAQKVVNLPFQIWEEYNYRQKKFDEHCHTQTIPILFDEDFRLHNPTPTYWYPLFEDVLRNLKQKMFKVYGEGHIIRCILVKLKARKRIPPHTDSGMTFNLAKRIHVPIVTTDEVVFTVGGEIKNMREGEMWQINNSQEHSVHNKSRHDRIHLIFDYVHTKEIEEVYDKLKNHPGWNDVFDKAFKDKAFK